MLKEITPVQSFVAPAGNGVCVIIK